MWHKLKENQDWKAVKRFRRQRFLQSKPLWGNMTVLYASLVSPICQVCQAGNFWSETLSSAICVSQIYLTSSIWGRGLFLSLSLHSRQSENSFVWKKMIYDEKGVKTIWFSDYSLSGVKQKKKFFAAENEDNVLQKIIWKLWETNF